MYEHMHPSVWHAQNLYMLFWRLHACVNACFYVLYVRACVCVTGGDRSSVGSSGSVTSVRSSGSGQSAGSATHILHAQAEGVKVTHTHALNKYFSIAKRITFLIKNSQAELICHL